jgi:hypothetical protein
MAPWRYLHGLNRRPNPQRETQPKPYKAAASKGLFLHVSVTGAKLWRMKFRQGGKEGLLSFGPYPEVTFAAAREKRDEARRLIREGKNAALEKRRAAIAARAAAANTFAIVAEAVGAKREREGLAPTTAAKLRWCASLLGALHDRPISEIEAFELLRPLRRIEASGGQGRLPHRAIYNCRTSR